MQRDDFSLTQDASEEIRKWYNKLLLETFDRATQLLRFNTKSVGEVQFAANSLAVFFFRLPLCSTMVVDALQGKPKEIKTENGFYAPANKLESGKAAASGSIPSIRRKSTLQFFKSSSRDEEDTSSSSSSSLPTSPQEKNGDSTEALMLPKSSLPTSPSAVVTTSAFKRATEEWTKEDKLFVDSNPDLFLWNSSLNDSTHTTQVFNHVLDSTTHWTKWLISKESFFLSFVEMFVSHVQRACSSSAGARGGKEQEIRWKLVPGYDLILSCFFPLMRSAIWWDSIARRTPGQGSGWVTSLQGYMRVKRTCQSLLQADKSLLPLLCQLAFECTNLHSLLSVDSGIEHLNLFFNTAAVNVKFQEEAFTAAPRGLTSSNISKKNESLPNSFDYDVFWSSFSKMMDSESYQVLLKCCSFLYNNLHLFYGKNRTKLVNDLLCPKTFFRLFLHWSPEVRTCFQHLVVYKVLRADRRYLPCFSDSQVMLLYGTSAGGNGKNSKKKTPVTSPRVQISAKAAWGKQDEAAITIAAANGTSSSIPAIHPPIQGNGISQQNQQDAPATADEIAQLTRSAQRRLSLFDRANAVDDEELWSDMAFSSKIDSFVRMCLSFRDKDGGGVPKELAIYVEPALEQYSLLLIRYYRGATLASLDEIPDTLSHRMMLSEFTESM
jgi:hypothetical protein